MKLVLRLLVLPEVHTRSHERRQRVRDIPSEVFLSQHDGMPRDSAVNCDHLQTVSKGKIGALVTSLPPAKMAAVGRAIRFALAI